MPTTRQVILKEKRKNDQHWFTIKKDACFYKYWRDCSFIEPKIGRMERIEYKKEKPAQGRLTGFPDIRDAV